MPHNSINREKKILEYLQQHGNASIQELVEIFGVSNMTIHRDLDKLEKAGHIQKKHGGAALAVTAATVEPCAMCGKSVSERTLFLLKLENENEKRACCAHCGLMLQRHHSDAWQSLTADYLRGHMVSAKQAVYLIGCDLNICCVPSILSFGSQADAEKFQKGFGGSLVTMEQAIRHLHA
jgi:DeoR family transcriptional regulator, copper-sensing transcriptional repressor